MMTEIVNATIDGATLSKADHGVLSSFVGLDYGNGGHQGFGGYTLYLPKDFKHHGIADGYAGHWIWRVMEIAGVDRWDDLVGKTVRAKADHTKVHAIGHITKDDWFCPAEDFKGGTHD